MSSFGYFCYLVRGSAEFLAYFAFVTLPVALVACYLVAWAWGRVGVRRGRILAACAVPAIIPVFILTIGVAFVRPERTAWGNGVHPPVPWFAGASIDSAESAIDVVFWLGLLLTAGLWWRARRGWPAALGSTLWWGWVSMCAGVMTGMSITGNWL